jgi:hypothetical protein
VNPDAVSPAAFIRRWAKLLPEGERITFFLEVAALMACEQARERRRLCTGTREEFDRACEQTAAELAAYTGGRPK